MGNQLVELSISKRSITFRQHLVALLFVVIDVGAFVLGKKVFVHPALAGFGKDD